MANPTATTVPYEDPDQSQIALDPVANPWLSTWWTAETVSGVPENVMGWLVAQGWKITAVASDASTNPPTKTYALAKQALSPELTLNSLCNSYTKAANDARFANEVRYNEVVADWTEALASSQTHFGNQVTAQNTDLGVYLTDLDTYMTAIETLTDSNAADLATDYAFHKTTTQAYLDNLGSTEVARINEQFAASLAVQLQDLTDRGMYSSGRAADLTERNTRDRDEQLQRHYDALARERLGNDHVLWNERMQLAQQNNQQIVQKMNSAVMRLEGWKHVAAENQKLMAYQLDTRNNLLIGLYSFVERREDVAPEWRDLSKMIAGLADSAGGWITP